MSISYIIFVIILAIVGGMLYTAESEPVNIDVYDKESKK
jgi:hypothetical protein